MSFAQLARRNSYRLFERTDYDRGTNVMDQFAQEMDARFERDAAKIRDARLNIAPATHVQEEIARQRSAEQQRIWGATNYSKQAKPAATDAGPTNNVTTDPMESNRPSNSMQQDKNQPAAQPPSAAEEEVPVVSNLMQADQPSTRMEQNDEQPSVATPDAPSSSTALTSATPLPTDNPEGATTTMTSTTTPSAPPTSADAPPNPGGVKTRKGSTDACPLPRRSGRSRKAPDRYDPS